MPAPTYSTVTVTGTVIITNNDGDPVTVTLTPAGGPYADETNNVLINPAALSTQANSSGDWTISAIIDPTPGGTGLAWTLLVKDTNSNILYSQTVSIAYMNGATQDWLNLQPVVVNPSILQYVQIPTNSPAAGNFLEWTGTKNFVNWAALPTGTTSAKGVLQLQGTPGNIQPLSASGPVAGNSGTAADGEHAHGMPRLDQILNPTASVAMNSQKLTGLARGSAATDSVYMGQLIPMINVQDPKYGAVGNGSTDDTEAWTDAISDAAADYLPIYAPATSAYYKITSSLAWTATTPCIIIGGATRANSNGSGIAAIGVDFQPGHGLDISNASYVHIQDINVIAIASNTGGNSADYVGIYIDAVLDGKIERVQIGYDGPSQVNSFVTGIEVYNNPLFWIETCVINCCAKGIWLTGPASGTYGGLSLKDITIGTVAATGAACVYMDEVSATLTMYNVITFQGDRGFQITNGNANFPAFIFINNFQVNNPSIAGIQLDDGHAVYINQYWMTGFQHATAGPVYGINIRSGFSGAFQMDNSVMSGLGGYGVWIQSGSGINIHNCQVGRVGAFASNTYDDIHIGGGVSNVSITGCHFDVDYGLTIDATYPNKSGLFVDPNSSAVTVTGNIFAASGYQTASMIDSGGVSVAIGNVNGIDAQVGWASIAPGGSWTASGSGVNGFWYRIMATGDLQIAWDVTISSSSPGTMVTLPAGSRPAQTVRIGSGWTGTGPTSYSDTFNPCLSIANTGVITGMGLVVNALTLFGTAVIPMGTL